jgi:integrase
MSILTTMAIPDYRLNESTGRGVATFGDRSFEFGPYHDPQSVQAFDRTLAAWLANGRRLPSAEDLADATRAAGPIPFEQFEAALLELYHPKLKAVATRRGLVHCLNILRELGVTSTEDFTVGLVARIVTTRDPSLSPNTVKGLLRYTQTIMSHAVKIGALKTSPFSVRPLRTWVRGSAPKGVKHLTKAQIKALLLLLEKDVTERVGFQQWHSRRLKFLINLICYTGMRKSECLYLKVHDIDFELNIINIADRAEHKCKNESSAKPVPMIKPLRDQAIEWLDHRMDAPSNLLRPVVDWVFPNVMVPTPWVGGCQGTRPLCKFKEAAVRAGIPDEDASLHALRRSLATHLEPIAAPSMIQRILRHSGPAVTEQYYRKADIANMHECMKGFSY